MHGSNRLASNSTLECLVFGRRCAEAIAGQSTAQKPALPAQSTDALADTHLDAEDRIIALKGIMVKYCGILRNGDELAYGLSQVEDMLAVLRHARLTTVREMELYNMASAARAILEGALARRVSVGSHYRTDGEEATND